MLAFCYGIWLSSAVTKVGGTRTWVVTLTAGTHALWEALLPCSPCRDLVEMVYNKVDRVPGQYSLRCVAPLPDLWGVAVTKAGDSGAAAATSTRRRRGVARGVAEPAPLFTRGPQRGAGSKGARLHNSSAGLSGQRVVLRVCPSCCCRAGAAGKAAPLLVTDRSDGVETPLDRWMMMMFGSARRCLSL